ncbi:MAG: dicarboxylate/amino acid:cation symporter [Bdellovibrionales bacterium]
MGGSIFVSSLKLLVAPLVLVSLVCGTAAIDDITKLGRVGTKTLAIYIATTAIAISFAVLAALIFQPGSGVVQVTESAYTVQQGRTFVETVISIVPTNPFASLANADMLQIIFFAGLLGISLTMSGQSGKKILTLFDDANEVIMKMVNIVMAFAPYGVFCLLTKTFAEKGIAEIADIASYFFVVLGVLIFHVFVTYMLIIKFVAHLSPITFFRKFKSVPMFAFSTASSGATIPVTLENVEHQLGVKNSIASFTIPLGATINMDGTAIMQGVATVFIAQYFGIELTGVQLLTVVGMATMASIGTAAVPGVGLITLAMVLNQVGLPEEGIGLIIGIDRLLDMARTAVNVTGDAAVTVAVARSEGQLDIAKFNSLATDL